MVTYGSWLRVHGSWLKFFFRMFLNAKMAEGQVPGIKNGGTGEMM